MVEKAKARTLSISEVYPGVEGAQHRNGTLYGKDLRGQWAD
jgi:hypothetical protein